MHDRFHFRTLKPVTDVAADAYASYGVINDLTQVFVEKARLDADGVFHCAGIDSDIENAVNVKSADFGAVGDGITNDAPAIQAAIDFAVENGRSVYFPAGVYLIGTCLDVHNTDGLKMFGEGCMVPASGLVYFAPDKGTVIKGNTGTTGFMLDAVGSTGLTLRDMVFSSRDATTPSRHGIVIGTSDRTYPTVDGGGGAAFFENVAIYVPLAVEAYPIYANNFNNSTLINVWSIGGWGPTIVSHNEKSITPPHGTFGIEVNNDGLSFIGCVWSTDGTGPCWYFRNVNEFTAVQNYLVTIANGETYAGHQFAVDIGDCAHFEAGLEVDYYPSAFKLSGIIDNVTFKGILYNNGAEVATDTFLLADWTACTSIRDLDMEKFRPIMGALDNDNFFYGNLTGATPSLGGIQGFKGYFDTTISPNIIRANATNTAPVPFRNIELKGDTETLAFGAVTFEVAGSFTSPDKFQNIFVNGWPIRTAIAPLVNGATPTVKYGQGTDRIFLTGGTTTITNFVDGFEGLKITILAEHTVTITDGTDIFLNGSSNFTMNASDSLRLICKADGKWYEIGRSDNT